MEPITIAGLFALGLYKATEKTWEKAFDAAWTPVDEALKERFARWAGTDKEAKRQAAFATAIEIARINTLRTAPHPQQAERILDALNSERDRRNVEALAEEAARLMLFSAAPDVPRLTEICQRTLRFEALFTERTPPPPDSVAVVLSDFLTNLREALLDQEPYHAMIQKDMRQTLREILTELRPVPHDDEATYRYQMAEMYRELEFVGIPELKERRPITVEDIFIHLRVERQIGITPDWELERVYDFITFQLGQREASGGRRVAREEILWLEEILAAIRGEIDDPRIMELRRHLERTAFVTEVSIEEALRHVNRMVVLGDPGTGKTTLLKYLTIICAEGRAGTEFGIEGDGTKSLLPVFIPLREFAAECADRNQDYCLLDYLYTHAREHLLLNLPRGFFEEALEAGRCLVCLDGLDEVWAVGQRKEVSNAVKALVALFRRSRYVVTSRVVGYEDAPLDRRDFVHHTVLPLADEDIGEFVRKWYKVRERDVVQRRRKADELITTIENEPRIKTLARNPLLLTIIALVHRIEAELPHERVKLYDKCVTALVDTWEEVKGLTVIEKQRPFYRYRRRLLERLAYELHAGAEEPGQLRTVKAGDLELLLTRFLMEYRRLGLAGDPEGAREEACAFIRLARGRTGLLIERGEGVFGFPHLTFQEYMAACDIENRCIHSGIDALWKEMESHLHDSHWREVILLLLGSLNKYDEPPTLLLERILEAGREDRFEPVLHRHLYLAARALADRVDAAGDLHRRIVSAMLEVAREASGWEQKDAFVALSWLEQDDYAANGLLMLARGERVADWVRVDAVRALGQLGHAEDKVLDSLLALARNEQMHYSVRIATAQALGQLGRAEETTEVLLALARDEQVYFRVRIDAAQALGQLGRAEEAMEVLLALAHDKQQVDGRVHRSAVQALGQLGRAEDKVLDGLLALACDEQAFAFARSDAARVLGQLGRVEEATEILLAMTHEEDEGEVVQIAAARALGQLGCAGGKVLDGLLSLACDEQMHTMARSDAIRALGQLGRAEDKVLDNLLALARDEQVDDMVRSDAARVLGQLGRAEEATEVLLALARDEQVHDVVRHDTAQALGQLGLAEEAIEVLLALVRGEQVYYRARRDAAQTLGQLGRAEGKVLNSLLALARDKQVSGEERNGAYGGLKQLVRNAVE